MGEKIALSINSKIMFSVILNDWYNHTSLCTLMWVNTAGRELPYDIEYYNVRRMRE